MFFAKYTLDQRQAFICLARELIVADGTEAPLETALLTNIISELGLAQHECILNTQESIAVFSRSGNSIKRSAYIELLYLAQCDTSFDKGENDYMQMISKSLGLPEDFCAQASEWIDKYSECVKRGFALVDG